MSRNPVVCSAAFASAGSIERNVEQARSMLDWAAADEADITCFPEIFMTQGVPGSAKQVAQPVPGQITDAIAKKAKEHNMYVICPLIENYHGALYNTSVVIGRDGSIIGKYHKFHPTIPEFESGVLPGKEFPVFDLDFGRIGCLICFDIYYPEVANTLAEKGAELLFYSTVFETGYLIQARAYDASAYIVSSSPPSTTGPSYFVDMTGEIIERRGKRTPLRSIRMNLERRVFCTDFNLAHHRAITEKYGQKVDIHVLDAEGIFTIGSRSPDLTINQIKKEFGLEELKDYLKRSAEVIKKTT